MEKSDCKTDASSRRNKRLVLTIRQQRFIDGAVFIGPSCVMFMLLFLIPVVSEFLYSFTNWNGVDPTFDILWFANYRRAFQDGTFWTSMWFTVKFSVCVVVASNVLAFFWAYILSKDIPFRNFFRAAIYVPRIIGGVILGYLWRFIFQEAFVQFGNATGLAWFAQDWFTTPESSFWALVIVMTWTLSGYLMLIYSAGLSSIDRGYYEAATIDGASKLRQLKDVTLPMMRATITRCLFIAINWAMCLYDTNISLTSGNPFRSSEGVTMNIYQTAFRSKQIGYGSAKSMIFVVILVAIAFAQIRLTSRKEVQL